MQREKIREILAGVERGEIPVDHALKSLERLPFEDIAFANIDHHRALRKGFPEVVYCEGKTPEQAAQIIERLSETGDVLATRASADVFRLVQTVIPRAEYSETARLIAVRQPAQAGGRTLKSGLILVMSAGTSDIPVAEEAALTAEVMGNRVERLFDVGVAGIHRLFANKARIDGAAVLVVAAGMDGALPSVVSGLVSKPVIAVPTSVGYGASFRGIAPLLAMLNACAPGVVVVNIDNGFGAGYFASVINS
ncbi:MAG: nickel pincer cofactor biosynthesis protein LarB [Deltaproteobacteria bacterium]